MKQWAAEFTTRGKVSEFSPVVSRTHTNDPRRDRIRIQRVSSRSVIAGRKHDIYTGVGEHLRRDVHWIVKVEYCVGRKTSISHRPVECLRLPQQIVEARKDEQQRRVTGAQAEDVCT